MPGQYGQLDRVRRRAPSLPRRQFRPAGDEDHHRDAGAALRARTSGSGREGERHDHALAAIALPPRLAPARGTAQVGGGRADLEGSCRPLPGGILSEGRTAALSARHTGIRNGDSDCCPLFSRTLSVCAITSDGAALPPAPPSPRRTAKSSSAPATTEASG